MLDGYDWWRQYEYILADNMYEAPNFKYPNEALFQLFDDDNFNNYVKDCAEKIIELLKNPLY